MFCLCYQKETCHITTYELQAFLPVLVYGCHWAMFWLDLVPRQLRIYNTISFQYQYTAVRTWFAINISQTCRLSRVNVSFKGFLDLKYIKCIDLLNMTWHCYDLPHYTALHTIKMLLMLMCNSVPAVPDCLSVSVCVWREAAEVVQCSWMWSVAVGSERRLLWQGSRLQRTQCACAVGPGL